MRQNVIAGVFRLLNKLFFRSSQPDVTALRAGAGSRVRGVGNPVSNEISDIEFISNTIDVDGKAYIRGRCENIDEGDCILVKIENSESLYYVDEIDYLPNQTEMFTAMITKITSN